MYLAYAVIQQLKNKAGKTKIGKTATTVDNVVFMAGESVQEKASNDQQLLFQKLQGVHLLLNKEN